MPRIGSRQNPVADPLKNTRALVPEAFEPDEDPLLAPLSTHRRENAVAAGIQTLEDIQKTLRKTRTKDGRIRRASFIAGIVALRHEGFTPKETAEIVGCSLQAVTYALTVIRKDANLDAQVARLDDIVVPLAIDNVARGVMNGDKEYTLRVLDGRGVFRTHQTVKGDIKATLAVLSVALELPAHLDGKALPVPKPGSIVGAPTLASGLPDAKVLEGVVVDG